MDEPLLRHVTASMKDPAAFLARVVDLYKHREESSADRLELADGRIIDRHTTPLYRGERGYLGRIWFFRDVTEQVAIELAVRRSEEKYRNLVEATTDYIWEMRRERPLHLCQPRGTRACSGMSPRRSSAKRLSISCRPRRRRALDANSVQSLQPGRRSRSSRTPLLRKDGAPIVIETSGVPIFDQSGVFIGYRGIDRDISARKRGRSRHRISGRAASRSLGRRQGIADRANYWNRDGDRAQSPRGGDASGPRACVREPDAFERCRHSQPAIRLAFAAGARDRDDANRLGRDNVSRILGSRLSAKGKPLAPFRGRCRTARPNPCS